MKLKGMVISRERIQRVMARAEAQREHQASSDGSGRDGFISEAVLAETLTRYPGCTCESLGLRAGVRITDMIPLGAGCTASAVRNLDGKLVGYGRGWVCERLGAVRRAYSR